MDLIDLGNLAFSRLIEAHGEIEESRLLFLYGVTTSARWQVLDSQKWLIIGPDGLSKNFADQVLDELAAEWSSRSVKLAEDQLALKLKRMREEYDRPALKPGDTFEFGKSSGEWRNLNFNL